MLQAKIWPNGEFWVGAAGSDQQGLVDLDKNHKSPRGSKGLTSGNKRLIRNAVHLLGEAYNVRDLTLFTGTLPGDSVEDCIRALEVWPELTRQFLQEVRRELVRVEFPPWFAGCTEIQPERFESTGQPWPHIHLVLPTRSRGTWVISGRRLKGLWSSIAARLLDRPVADFFVSGRVDQCTDRKKLGKYLGKYMSKASPEDVLAVLDGKKFPRVNSWKHCSTELCRAVEGCTSKLTCPVSKILFAIAKNREEGCEVWAEIADSRNLTGEDADPVGYVGTLTPELIGWLLQHDDLWKSQSNALPPMPLPRR